MSGSGKGLLGLWLYRSGDSEWALKEGSPLHKKKDLVVVNITFTLCKTIYIGTRCICFSSFLRLYYIE